jgi:maltose alpha-D-glucosyltransferase/alpha-amylase
VPHQGTGWYFVREELRRFYERALATSPDLPRPPPRPPGSLLELASMETPGAVRELLGSSLVGARLLGKRTADLHLALVYDDPAFSLEPYTALDQRSVYQTKRNLTGKVLRLLRSARPTGRLGELAQLLLAREKDLYRRFEPLLEGRLTAQRQRIHGSYHLLNLLWTGKDFVVVDFDGDISRPLPERRRKRSPLRDVASMIRSFDYAASMALRDEAVVREADRALAEPWNKLWMTWVPAAFLGSYLEAMGKSPSIPRNREELDMLLDTQLLEKALDELGAEIGVREDWAFVAVRALLEMLGV